VTSELTGYLSKILLKIRPDVVGLSAMAWQDDDAVADACLRLFRGKGDQPFLLLPEFLVVHFHVNDSLE